MTITRGTSPPAMAVEYDAVSGDLDRRVRPAFRPSRSAAESTTSEGLPGGAAQHGTQLPRPRLPDGPPSVNHRSASH
ncbi:hypothetical protein [Streptomyces alanosinicus]|uniref:Uncharacterized protein n=1 Tax=Streptomyces alanosinicus TaxID=68171 RepID=A0A919D284_9ACTN|nr:hypothetical protein [Streptomyces alanosinicus]GHE04881.1 hypothetical protein GCM10010339_38210 [Streptomyces alanosinicus]